MLTSYICKRKKHISLYEYMLSEHVPWRLVWTRMDMVFLPNSAVLGI